MKQISPLRGLLSRVRMVGEHFSIAFHHNRSKTPCGVNDLKSLVLYVMVLYGLHMCGINPVLVVGSKYQIPSYETMMENMYPFNSSLTNNQSYESYPTCFHFWKGDSAWTSPVYFPYLLTSQLKIKKAKVDERGEKKKTYAAQMGGHRQTPH